MPVLTVVWWIGAVVGLVAVVVAVLHRSARRAGLWIAATSWLVAGVLGLASIGVFFLVAAIGCGVAATRTPPATPDVVRTLPGSTA